MVFSRVFRDRPEWRNGNFIRKRKPRGAAHHGDKPNPQLHRVLGLAAEMMVRQGGVEPDPGQRATKRACEDQRADREASHDVRPVPFLAAHP